MKEKLREAQVKVLMSLEDNPGITYERLAFLSGLSYDGVRGRVSELCQKGFNIKKLKKSSSTVLKYEKKIGGKNMTKKFIRPHTYGDMVSARLRSTEDFYGVTNFLDNMRVKPSKKKKINISAGDKVGLLILSDLHFGEVIKNGKKVVYNTQKASNRMEYLSDDVINRLSEYGADSLYIAIIGDVVDGDMIYKNHMFYVEKPAIEQVKDAVNSISNLIDDVSNAGYDVSVGCVRGNHGITNYKNLEADNWDNVAYDMLDLIYENNEDVEIEHFQSREGKIDIFDKQIVLYHGEDMGDQIKTASGLRSFRGMCGKHKLNDGDMIIVGHLHSFGVENDQSKFLIRNGALTDASEYAFKLNVYNEPEQTLLILEDGVFHPVIVPLEFKE